MRLWTMAIALTIVACQSPDVDTDPGVDTDTDTGPDTTVLDELCRGRTGEALPEGRTWSPDASLAYVTEMLNQGAEDWRLHAVEQVDGAGFLAQSMLATGGVMVLIRSEDPDVVRVEYRESVDAEAYLVSETTLNEAGRIVRYRQDAGGMGPGTSSRPTSTTRPGSTPRSGASTRPASPSRS